MHVQIASKHKLSNAGTTQLRCNQPAEYLRSRGISVTVSQFYKSLPKAVDVLVLHRVKFDDFTDKYIEYAKSLGAIVVYDTDDLIFSESDDVYFKKINRSRYSSSSEINPFKQAMSLCDVVLVSVPYLASEAQKFHNDVRVIRNALSRKYLEEADKVYKSRLEKQSQKKITIAYLSGSSSHDYDFKIVEQTLLELLSKNSKVKILIVGPLNHSREFLQFGDRFSHVDFVQYSEFPKLFSAIDINFVPLEIEEPFCQGKSELKYIEAGACGVPSIMSSTKVFSEIIEDKSNGILVQNGNWIEAIEYLLENPAQRMAIGSAARNHVVSSYSPHARSAEWEELVRNISSRYGDSRNTLVGSIKKFTLRITLERMRFVRYASSIKERLLNKFKCK